jgi:myo-inositol 2-dehydrogenase / D-chiro-inositol 1-dehydrogenase
VQSDPDRIAVGVVGAGGMGAAHAENLHARVKGVQVVAVMDADPARAEEVAARYGSASVFGDAHEMIADDGVEAVVIASPDPTHAELTLECLRRKKPVLCEKPLATTAEDALEVVEAEVGVGRKSVEVGFMRRYDPQHLGVRDAVARGDVGRPVLLKGGTVTRRRFPARRRSSSFSAPRSTTWIRPGGCSGRRSRRCTSAA